VEIEDEIDEQEIGDSLMADEDPNNTLNMRIEAADARPEPLGEVDDHEVGDGHDVEEPSAALAEPAAGSLGRNLTGYVVFSKDGAPGQVNMILASSYFLLREESNMQTLPVLIVQYVLLSSLPFAETEYRRPRL
jgi:hypothetical protein